MGSRYDNSFDSDPDVVDWDAREQQNYRDRQDEQYPPDDTLDEDNYNDEIEEDEDDYDREVESDPFDDYDDDVEENSDEN